MNLHSQFSIYFNGDKPERELGHTDTSRLVIERRSKNAGATAAASALLWIVSFYVTAAGLVGSLRKPRRQRQRQRR